MAPALPRMLSSRTQERVQGWGGRVASRPRPRRTLTDSQQGHIDEEVPNGGDHILAHLSLHLLGVQLRRETLDPEHCGSFSKACRRCTPLSSSGRLAPELSQTPLPVPPLVSVLRQEPARDNPHPGRVRLKARRPEGGGRSLKSRSPGGSRLFLR